ncbi:MAG: metal ABC transporter ATP-binding protein [candidate division FCPU426 bacterium]
MSVRLDNLVVQYGSVSVLDHVNLEIPTGAYVGIVGPNGSGKTTLIKAILGLTPKTSGRIELLGRPLEQFDQWQRVGYLPQFMPLARQGFPIRVREVVAMGRLANRPFPRRLRPPDRTAVADILRELKISDWQHQEFGSLSGGQRQRVLLARALVSHPDLLILDEPTAALDPETRIVFYRILEDLNRRLGTTILLITHESGTIGQFAQRLLYLDRKVIFYGGFKDFCLSREMTNYFGDFAQHIICHQHQEGQGS